MTTLGRYELGRVLGRGGMGTVYEAVLRGPAGFRKQVAVKVLHGGGEGLAREARLGGLLRHRNLVEIYELGEVDGTWFCAMELVPGGSLVEHVPLPPRAVVEVGLQVCAALTHAHHAIGLVHLDLKPANLLLDGATVKVADFGVAVAPGLVDDARLRGTKGYMSPEQAQNLQVDARSDIYSLGIVLQELATAASPETSETWLADAKPTTRSIEPVTWLAPVLDRCLAEDPDDRFPDTEAVAAALRELEVSGPGLRELFGPRPAPSRHRTNLTADASAFVGRDSEQERLAELLGRGGLVTVKGPGGVGKTRLARQVGLAWHHRTSAEVWFVDLQAARDRDDVLKAVATSLGTSVHGPAHLAHVLERRGEATIILDNFEQLADCAEMVDAWRHVAPDVRWLVTSQATLGLPGEQVVELAPLPHAQAVALLRARAADRGRTFTEDDALPELIALLEGLPLALELAGARLGLVTPATLVERLRAGFTLTDRGATRPERQRTLDATLAWSWGLLDEVERHALAQLSVFVGGFTLEAAEAVVELPDGLWVLDVVDTLCDRSLVLLRGGDRFALLESVRRFARARLSDQSGAIARHARFFAQNGSREVLLGADSPRAGAWLARLTADLDNAIAACRWAVEAGDAVTAAGTLRAAWAVLSKRGPASLGRSLAADVEAMEHDPADATSAAEILGGAACLFGDWDAGRAAFDRALASARESGSAVLQSLVHASRGMLALDLGDLEGAQDEFERGYARAREASDGRCLAFSRSNLGLVAATRGDAERAERLYRECIRGARKIGLRRLEGINLGNLGVVVEGRGDYAGSLELHRASAEAARDVGDRRSEAWSLMNVGLLTERCGDLAGARPIEEQALAIAREVADRALEAFGVAVLGGNHLDRGDLPAAEELLGAALALYRDLGPHPGRALVLVALAVTRWRGGRHAAAREAWREAHRIGLADPIPERWGDAVAALSDAEPP